MRDNVFVKYRQEFMGLACVMVMICHIPKMYLRLAHPLVVIFTRGIIGVDIFLFLSGIGMVFSLTNQPSKRKFYKKRYLRLLLPYVIISCPYWLLHTLITKDTILNFIINFTGLSVWMGTGVLTVWYVALIAILYSITPLIFGFMSSKIPDGIILRKGRSILILVIAIIFNILLLLLAPHYYEQVEIALARIPIFIMGIVYGILILEGKGSKKAYLILLVVAPLLLVGVLYFSPSAVGLWRLSERLIQGLTGLTICFIAGIIIRFIPTILRKFLVFMGSISLECYLVHLFVIHIIHDIIENMLLIPIETFFPSNDILNIIVYILLMIPCIGIAYLANTFCSKMSKKWC